ncbi:LppX_LprAFG lipoprotein [Microtetraspora niveoalba]|uniref:LppX_LprAFG lipoprotein n=1 Tax=Microtetraspora niveoalba TaxID=46175 RepID=UPI0009FE05E1|nr:LppX_LprAFG lipoprotein [Microtetraspora niveoalba]
MRRLLLAAGAAALIGVAGCAPAATSLGNVKLSASEVLQQASDKAQDVTSYTADLVLNFSDAGGRAGVVQGKMRYQQKPTLATDLTLDQIAVDGRNVPGGLRVILQGETVYVRSDTLKTLVGATKPWIKVDLKNVGSSGGVDVDEILGRIQQIDLKTSVALLTASKDVKPVGGEQVGGVDTTHYSGTFPVAEALKQVAPEARAKAEAGLAELDDMKFDAWIDADGLPRKITLKGDRDQGAFDATVAFTSFNETAAIEAPPAGEVGELPRNIHGG